MNKYYHGTSKNNNNKIVNYKYENNAKQNLRGILWKNIKFI